MTDTHLNGFYPQRTMAIFSCCSFSSLPSPSERHTGHRPHALASCTSLTQQHLLSLSTFWVCVRVSLIAHRIRRVMTKVRFLSPFTPLFIKQTFTECLPSARSCAEVTIRSSQPRLVSLWCLLGTGSGGGVLLQGRQCKKKIQ